MSDHWLVDNAAGWRLSLTRHRPEHVRGRPALIVPGYGMNSFIFGFHPNGPSLVESLVARGIETWTVDLRGQGRSIRARGNRRYGLADLAVEDVGAALAHVVAHTETGSRRVDLLGVSLGAALVFGHLALSPAAPVGSVVSLGGLVTWREVHPLVRLAFASPRAAGLVRFRSTRRFARLAFPLLARVAPGLLSLYVNVRSTDLTQAARMVQTVEDPHPPINREIAEWIKRGDLVLRDVNVSRRVRDVTNPFLCVVARNDGIVTPKTSRHTFETIGSTRKRLLEVGDPATPIAHADLFLARGAQERVFAPVADFLQEEASSS